MDCVRDFVPGTSQSTVEVGVYVRPLLGHPHSSHLLELGLVHGTDRAAALHEDRAQVQNSRERGSDRDALPLHVDLQHRLEQGTGFTAREKRDFHDHGEEGGDVDRQRRSRHLLRGSLLHRMHEGSRSFPHDAGGHVGRGHVLRVPL